MSNDSSSVEDDEDIPGLESVSSSEYVDDSDDEGSGLSDGGPAPSLPKTSRRKSPHVVMAEKWLRQETEAIKKHLKVITIYMYSPFLYGHAHQSDKWLGWCYNVGLLVSDINYNTGELSDLERSAVDVLDKAIEWCRNNMKEGVSPESLAQVLQLSEEIRSINLAEEAVKTAKKKGWFTTMLQSFDGQLAKAGGVTNDLVEKENLVEIGCLYAINETAEHVRRYVKEKHDAVEEFEKQCSKDEKKFDQMKRKGDELYKLGKHLEAIEEYSNTIICCPFNYRLYTNRALCYLELKQSKAALSDGLRAIFLKPDWAKGYARYLQALNACGELQRAQASFKKYLDIFPNPKEKELLRRAMDIVPTIKEKKNIEPTEEDKVLKDKLMGICKQASEAYLQGNNEQAVFYYEEAIGIAEGNKGWQHCMQMSECMRFLVSLYYAYGCALLKSGGYEGAVSALDQFDVIIDEYQSMRFPPAFCGAARAYIALHRHSEALTMVVVGLELVSTYRPTVNIVWPGVEEVMQECLPQNVEIKLQQLQEQCEPVCLSDAICRYGNCLQHHTSTNIRTEYHDYKGHVMMQCTESCSTNYHATCWRRFKTDSVIGTDRDFLLTTCSTPDCSGIIKLVAIYDHKGLKIKFDAPPEALARKLPQLPQQTATAPPKKPSAKKARKKKDKEEKAVVEDVLPPQRQSSGEEMPPSTVETTQQKEEVNGAEEEESQVSEEDLRKAEDSLAVINRQAELEDTKDSVVFKSKAKKKKQTKPKEKDRDTTSSQHWNELFTLPEREGLVGEEACLSDKEKRKQALVTFLLALATVVFPLFPPPERDGLAGDEAYLSAEEERKQVLWQPDPNAPFQVPDHLRDAIVEFESTEVPAIGLKPRPVNTPTTGVGAWSSFAAAAKVTEEGIPPTTSSEDFEFINSYFAEILKSEGALRPTDPKLTEPLTFLPEDNKKLIENAGGLGKFLLRSTIFRSHGELICLTEDAPIVAASISSGSSSSIGSSNNRSSKETKLSLHTLINEHQPDTLSGADTVSLKFEEKQGKTYGESLGSGVNSPSESPPLNSPRLRSPVDSPKVAKKPSDHVEPPRTSKKSLEEPPKVTKKLISPVEPPKFTKKFPEPRKTSKKQQSDQTELAKTSRKQSDAYNRKPSIDKKLHTKTAKTLEKGDTRGTNGVSSGKTRNKDLFQSSDTLESQRSQEAPSPSTPGSHRFSLCSSSEEGEIIGNLFDPVESKDSVFMSSSSSGDSGKTLSQKSDGGKMVEKENTKLPAENKTTKHQKQQQKQPQQQPQQPKSTKAKDKKKADDNIPLGKEPIVPEGAPQPQRPKPLCFGVCVQTDPPLTIDKWVMTDPVPPVESYKERHDMLVKEKRDLHAKLEECEDRRYKMQRDYKRELEKLQKRSKQEAREEAQSKIRELEGKVVEERNKVQQEKKEQSDQIRSLKAEIKSLSDKIERLKKDLAKKEQQINTTFIQQQSDLERSHSDRKKMEDRLRAAQDMGQNTLQRAITAEIELLSLRRETILRPGEQRVQEVERICSQFPRGSDLQREWSSYGEKLSTSLDCFKNAMDDQIRQVKTGRELVTLDRVPNPVVPLPPQLAIRMPMVRPPFMPMMHMRGPMPPHPPPMEQTSLPAIGTNPPGGMIPPPTQGPPMVSNLSMANSQSQFNPPTLQQAALQQAAPTNLPSDIEAITAGGKSKSSFDRIVDKLAPKYPHYSREDFKGILRDVRRSNNNTLSGLSLDSIAQQVQDTIDIKERGRTGKLPKGRQRRLPPVAQAPPLPSFPPAMEYDDEGSCIICYEDMLDTGSSVLSCGHRFHTDCIRSWFKEQNTCPTCRNHSLLTDDFPFLGQ